MPFTFYKLLYQRTILPLFLHWSYTRLSSYTFCQPLYQMTIDHSPTVLFMQFFVWRPLLFTKSHTRQPASAFLQIVGDQGSLSAGWLILYSRAPSHQFFPQKLWVKSESTTLFLSKNLSLEHKLATNLNSRHKYAFRTNIEFSRKCIYLQLKPI